MTSSIREVDLINAFINSGIIKGWCIGEFPIGRRRLKQMGFDYRMGRFRIDLVCVEGVYGRKPMRFDFRFEEFILREARGKPVWLLEVKRELNAEAIGQILIAKYLFPEDYPELHVKGLGIVCEITDEILEDICRKLGIHVFKIHLT